MAKVLIVFGSKSDAATYDAIAAELKKQNVDYELRVISAHRTSEILEEVLAAGDYAVIVAGAGLAAHLPGVCASKTIKPIIGVPCKGNYQGLDALLSIVQMPPGIPVLGVGVDQGTIAGFNAAKLLKKYNFVNLVGDKDDATVQKAVKLLDQLSIPFEFNHEDRSKAVNIEFISLDQQPAKKEDLVIYVPMMLKGDDTAEASLHVLKHSQHGLWVGLNRGDNAAIAAIEVMNVDGAYEDALKTYRMQMAEKVKKDDAEVKKK